jgi:hypothetical protein
MKASIEFNLEDEFDKWRYDVCNHSLDILQVVKDFEAELRMRSKHLNDEQAGEYRETLWQICCEHQINHLL